MGKRPNAHGNATIKNGDEWLTVGDADAWHNETDCGGVIKLNVKKLIEHDLLDTEATELKINFRVWKGN